MDAYRWWNAQVAGADLDSPPQVVLPHIAHSIFGQICPVFLLFVIDQHDIQHYWESVQGIVEMFDKSGAVPNPLTHFPEFISKVFSMKNVMSPRTVTDCLQFIDTFGSRDIPHFFLYQLPVFAGDPILYHETLIELRRIKHKMWTHFICRSKLVDAFFEMHSSFVVPAANTADERQWRHRVLIVEVMFLLLCDVSHFHPNAPALACSFVDLATPMIVAPLNYSVSVLRALMAVIGELGDSVPKEQFQVRIMRLIDAVENADVPCMMIVARFILSLKQNVGKGYLLKVILSRGIRSMTDFDVIKMTTDVFNVIPVVAFLVRSALSNKLLHRACFKIVIDLLKTFGGKQDVRDYVTVMVRKLFIFIALATNQRKYRLRTLYICESLARLARTKELNWIQPSIYAYAAGVNTRAAPPHFRSFFPTPSTCDDVLIHEIDAHTASNTQLKHFPFDPTKGTLIVPPGRDDPISRKAIQVSKSEFPSVSVTRERSALAPKKKMIQLQRNRPSNPSSVRTPAYKTRTGALTTIPRRAVSSARKKTVL